MHAAQLLKVPSKKPCPFLYTNCIAPEIQSHKLQDRADLQDCLQLVKPSNVTEYQGSTLPSFVMNKVDCICFLLNYYPLHS